jgi:hypothetical protein
MGKYANARSAAALVAAPFTGGLSLLALKGDSSTGGKKKDASYEQYKALQYQKAPQNMQSSVPSLMPKEAKLNQSRTNSLNAMRANSFGLMK